MATRKVRILNITGAMAYGVEEKDAGKVVAVDSDLADALVGMRFAEEAEDPPMKGARGRTVETETADVKLSQGRKAK
jgi:hypothetical protein